MSKKRTYTHIYYGISFGATMVASLYFGYKGGAWLDNYFKTNNIFSLLGILLGIAVSFKSLWDNLNRNSKRKDT